MIYSRTFFFKSRICCGKWLLGIYLVKKSFCLNSSNELHFPYLVRASFLIWKASGEGIIVFLYFLCHLRQAPNPNAHSQNFKWRHQHKGANHTCTSLTFLSRTKLSSTKNLKSIIFWTLLSARCIKKSYSHYSKKFHGPLILNQNIISKLNGFQKILTLLYSCRATA